MAEIVHFNAKEEQLDNSLKLIEPGYYEVDNGRVKSEFHELGNEVVFINKNRRISWKPENMKYLDEFGIEDVIYSVEDVPLEVKGNYARYNRTMPDVDDWFIHENDRLKHQILVQGFQREPMPWLSGMIDFIIGGRMSFDADLTVIANGTEQRSSFETNGGIELFDGNDLIFTLPQIIAFDSNFNRTTTTGKYRVYFDDNADMRFDIVLDNEWIASMDRVYPIVIDPTVIVNTGYTLGYPNERRGVELANGWLVTAVYDSTNKKINLFKSSDRGETWTDLCYVQNGTNSLIYSAISSYGNTVHIAFNNEESLNMQTRFVKVDATTAENTNVYANSVPVFGATKAEGFSGVSVFTEPTGKIHIASSFRVGSMSYNPYNIYYTSSSDGGVTWAVMRNLTNYLEDIYKAYRPSVMVANGKPFVIFEFIEGGTYYGISIAYYTGSAWIHSQNGVRYSSQSDLQYSSVTVDKNNVLHAVWSENSEGNGRANILYSKSTDGGATWSAAIDLTPTDGRKNMPSITVGKNGYLYVFFIGGNYDGSTGYKQVSRVIFDGVSWSAEVNLTAYTTIKEMQVSTFYDPTLNSNLVGWLWSDGSTVQFDKIVLNQAPNAPILSTRENFDNTSAATFTFTHSDPDPSDGQSAYQLQIVDTGNGLVVVDTGKVASTVGSYTLPSNSIMNGKQYQWRARTWDNTDTDGLWSDYFTFYTSAKPSVVITSITEGQSYVLSSMTVQWTMSDPESEGQSAYQVQLLSSTDEVLWDSGKVLDSRSRSRTLGYTLENDTSYKIRMTVWDAKDVKSESVAVSFNVAYTAPPVPIVEAVAASGHIVLTITNPVEVSPQPKAIGNDIYKRIDGEWVRIAKDISYQYRDYAVKSGEEYEYKVRANGDNVTYADSDSVFSSTTFMGVWLHKITDPEGSVYKFKFDGRGRSSNWEPEHSFSKFAGRKYPVIETGVCQDEGVSFALDLISELDTEALKNIVKSRETVCYRDGRGRMITGVFTNFPLNDEKYGQSVSLEINQIDYREGV